MGKLKVKIDEINKSLFNELKNNLKNDQNIDISSKEGSGEAWIEELGKNVDYTYSLSKIVNNELELELNLNSWLISSSKIKNNIEKKLKSFGWNGQLI